MKGTVFQHRMLQLNSNNTYQLLQSRYPDWQKSGNLPSWESNPHLLRARRMSKQLGYHLPLIYRNVTKSWEIWYTWHNTWVGKCLQRRTQFVKNTLPTEDTHPNTSCPPFAPKCKTMEMVWKCYLKHVLYRGYRVTSSVGQYQVTWHPWYGNSLPKHFVLSLHTFGPLFEAITIGRWTGDQLLDA